MRVYLKSNSDVIGTIVSCNRHTQPGELAVMWDDRETPHNIARDEVAYLDELDHAKTEIIAALDRLSDDFDRELKVLRASFQISIAGAIDDIKRVK